MRQLLPRLALAVGAVAAAVLCAGREAGAHGGGTWSDFHDRVLAGCSCHIINTADPNVGNCFGGSCVSSEDNWYAAFVADPDGIRVGQRPTNTTAQAYGKFRVDPGRPWNSYLLDKLTGDLKFGEQDPMPRFSTGTLFGCPGAVDKLARWILAGAPREGYVADDDPTQLPAGYHYCDKNQPGLTQPPPPGDGVQLAPAAFAVSRPKREDEQSQTVSLDVSGQCGLDAAGPCYVTGVDIAVSPGTEYVEVSFADGPFAGLPIAVARGEQVSLSFPPTAGIVGVPIVHDQQLTIRQRIRNDYWICPGGYDTSTGKCLACAYSASTGQCAAPSCSFPMPPGTVCATYVNRTTGTAYVNVHLAPSVDHAAAPFQDDLGSKTLFVPPRTAAGSGGVAAAGEHGALVGIWTDRRAIGTAILDAAGEQIDPAARGYVAVTSPLIAYECAHDNTVLKAPLKWGCEGSPAVPGSQGVPTGKPALLGAPSPPIFCTRSSESGFSSNDCGFGGKCKPANLVFGPLADDGRCTLVGVSW